VKFLGGGAVQVLLPYRGKQMNSWLVLFAGGLYHLDGQKFYPFSGPK